MAGKKVALAGHFSAMNQEEAARIIEAFGGQWVRAPAPGSHFLVIGQEGWPLDENGRLTHNVMLARRLRAAGEPLEVITEQQFLELVGLARPEADAGVRRLYSTAEAARILDVPGPRIRDWVRRGLVAPVLTEQGVDYFDFTRISAVRHVQELVTAGVSPARIRDSLERVRTWLPGAGDALEVLQRLEEHGGLQVRLDGGAAAEPSGQLLLPLFEAASEPVAGEAAADALGSAEELLAQAAEHEDRGEAEAAARLYRKALMRGAPEGEVNLRLGNLLAAAGRKLEGLARLEQAVRAQPRLIEAWTQLAGLLTELERFDEAVVAAERALELDPEAPGAHFNAALALLASGRTDEARRHGHIYLRHDPDSEWAAQLRNLLDLDD